MAIAIGAASRLRADDGDVVPGTAETGEGWLVERWEWEARLGSTYRLDRLVTIHTSRDGGRPDEAAAVHVEHLVDDGGERVAAAHAQSWQARWQAADVAVEGDPEAQRALRFATYHLIGAANPEDAYVSVGARALTGDAYKGHVFWDTEIYLLPFYTFTWPEAARALLLYRHHTLPAAREKARRLGYAGALFAWESADSGEEATPAVVVTPEGEVVRILTGEQEHHISADVAYAVWQYWQATADDDFLREAGAEIVLETARFWASRGQVEADGRYHIRRVIGPDEYHEGVDDNAYTNGMAQWNLERGAEAAQILGSAGRSAGRIWPSASTSREEIRRWPELAQEHAPQSGSGNRAHRAVPGYFGLEEIDLDAYPGRTVPMDVLLGRERIQRSQVLKQADVVLLLYLLWDRFPPPVRDANFRYYEPRTGHGSSLSPAIHALMAARLGDMELAQRFFQQAAEIDLANTMGNAAGGIHIAALAGLWQAAVFGFAGVRWDPNGLALDPHLPPGWRRLSFPSSGGPQAAHPAHRGAGDGRGIPEGGPASVRLADGPPITLAPGRRVRTRRTNGRWERGRRWRNEDGPGPPGRLEARHGGAAGVPRAGGLEGASLRILHVGQPFLPPREFFDRLGLTPEDVQGLVLDQATGPPAESIVRLARHWRSVLIVLCTHTPASEVPEGRLARLPEQVRARRPARSCLSTRSGDGDVGGAADRPAAMAYSRCAGTRDGAGAARRRRTGRAARPDARRTDRARRRHGAPIPGPAPARVAPVGARIPGADPGPEQASAFGPDTARPAARGARSRDSAVRERVRRRLDRARLAREPRAGAGQDHEADPAGSPLPNSRPARGRARRTRRWDSSAPGPRESARPQHKRRLPTSPMEDTPHESATSSASRGQRPRRQRQAGHRRNHALISTG